MGKLKISGSNKIRIKIIVLFSIISCLSFGQVDSSLFCIQYNKAIDYIRQDTMVKCVFETKKNNFKISDELIAGGIDPDFFEEYMMCIFNKPFDSITKGQIDSTYCLLRKDSIPLTIIYKINCLNSDKDYNLNLRFARENDTIFGASIYKIQNASHYRRAEKRERKKMTLTFDTAVHYLFIFDKQNNIIYVMKKKSF